MGKRFFYELNHQGFPVEKNTVMNYECSISLSYTEFKRLIQNITGYRNPTESTNKYNYHLPKQDNLIDLIYCTRTLGLPNAINGCNLATIAIAANYKKNFAKGNILFIFTDPNNQDNEICISVHIKYSSKDTNYLNSLIQQLNQAANQISSPNNALWQLKPWDDFNRLGYVVTSGEQEAADYRSAYENEISNQIYNLVN